MCFRKGSHDELIHFSQENVSISAAAEAGSVAQYLPAAVSQGPRAAPVLKFDPHEAGSMTQCLPEFVSQGPPQVSQERHWPKAGGTENRQVIFRDMCTSSNSHNHPSSSISHHNSANAVGDQLARAEVPQSPSGESDHEYFGLHIEIDARDIVSPSQPAHVGPHDGHLLS